MTIQTITISSGAAVRFPFELKNSFREHFPSAKWNPAQKQWEVGSRSVKRLEQWVAVVENSGVIEEIEERDAATFADEEIAKLERQYAAAQKRLEEIRSTTATAKERAAMLRAAAEQLDAINSSIAEAETAREAAEADAAEAEDAVNAIVGRVVDIEQIERVRAEMRRHMKTPKAWASAKYDEARAELISMRNQLRAAGIESRGINAAISANRNRPQRDFDDLFLPFDFALFSDEE